MKKVLLEVENLKTYFPVKEGFFSPVKKHVKAVDGVSFKLYKGETLGLVGESGCGKSTLARTILRLIEPIEGAVYFNGVNILTLSSEEMVQLRQDIQMIFQDPYSSLNPRKMVKEIIGQAFEVHRRDLRRSEREEQVKVLMSAVGLDPEYMVRYPHEFSGGQRQRIGIARALALNPKLIIADEPVSALDVSVQSQILNLLNELQEKHHLTYIFIAHNLSVVKHVSDRVGVMYLGKIVEMAKGRHLYRAPLHPYTQALLSAIPIPKVGAKKEQILLDGDVPSPHNPPLGCRFHNRCRHRMTICQEIEPVLKDTGAGHLVACHLI